MTEKTKKSSAIRKKKRVPFFPNSPSCIGSPTSGVKINRRTVCQLTPQKLCCLVLPPPLLSLFDADGGISARGADEISVSHGRQASNMSVSGASTGTHHNARLPPHIRVGFAKCDPLLVFGGQYVLVATVDGRIAVYSLSEFDNDVSEDIKMSERRRQREWEEEDSASQQDARKEDKKVDDDNKISNEIAEEENEWEIRERMNRRERAKLIDPLIVVTLPVNKRKKNNLDGSAEDQGSVNLFSPSTITDMCATPKRGTSLVEQRNTTTSEEEFLGHVAVLTEDGEVHVLEFTSSKTPNQTSEGSGDNDGISNTTDIPIVNTILSFEIENSGATSICMYPTDGDNQTIRLCVGSESGLLSGFRLQSILRQHSTTSSPKHLPSELARQRSHDIKLPSRHPEMNPLQRQFSEPRSSPSKTRQTVDGPSGTIKVILCWKGFSDAPIRALSCPGWGGTKPKACSLLVVGTEQRQHANAMKFANTSLPHSNPPPAISLDVINASLAETIWRNSNNSKKAVPLADCSVWPAAGMELKDGWLRSTTNRKPDSEQLPLNVGNLQKVSTTTNKLCCFEESDQCFASAASDGTVAISHCLEDGSWGIIDENNQIMLSQQCIGLGAITSENERNERYLACCLRGGTVYLIPVAEGTGPRKDIAVYTTPVESSDCGAIRYVQNFIAGLAQVKSWPEVDKLPSMKCAALIGWAGGKIDVYELTPLETRNNLLLEKLVERGTVSKIVDMMMIMDENHSKLQSALWKRAWNECMNANDESESIANRIRNLNDDTFEGTRSLILSMVNDTRC